MKLDEGQKENLKWIMGLFAGFMIVALKFTLDNYVEGNKRVEIKIDKVFDFAVDHEARVKVLEAELTRERKSVFDLQIAQIKLETYVEVAEKRRVEEQAERENENKNRRR